ncbi:MAG TPA: hypothetical protein VFM53_05400 [Anaeromyxobacteraceae bacterium]|nr:hypothetical protein [Anaeromyxobacteraceae bacterium]
MPYGELLRALEAEVDAQCRAEEERSRREVEAILAEGRRESADARDAALARARADAAALVEQARRRAALTVDRAVLAEQHRILDAVRAAAAAALPARSTPALTRALLAEPLDDDDGSPLRVTCDPGHAAACRAAIAERGAGVAARTTVVEAEAPRGGVELSFGADLAVDNTFASRLERAWPLVLPDVARELFGGVP